MGKKSLEFRAFRTRVVVEPSRVASLNPASPRASLRAPAGHKGANTKTSRNPADCYLVKTIINLSSGLAESGATAQKAAWPSATRRSSRDNASGDELRGSPPRQGLIQYGNRTPLYAPTPP